MSLTALTIALQTPNCLPTLLWGDPGIGKTSRIRDLCRTLRYHLETIIASIREPADFLGQPIPHNGAMTISPPDWAIRLKTSGNSLLFLDEISCSPPAVQAALLRVVHERVVGDLELPDSVKVVAAGNPPNQAAAGWDLSPALANRFVHLKWDAPSAKEWSDWLLEAENPLNDLKISKEDWRRAWVKSRALVTGFIKAHGVLLEKEEAYAGRFPLAYLSPRTMECAARLLASCFALGPIGESVQHDLIAGAIGEPVMLEMMTYVQDKNLPDPEDLISNPESWNPEGMEGDRLICALRAVSLAAVENGCSEKKRKARQIAAWRVLERSLPCGHDMVANAGLTLVRNRSNDVLTNPDVQRVADKIIPITQACII